MKNVLKNPYPKELQTFFASLMSARKNFILVLKPLSLYFGLPFFILSSPFLFFSNPENEKLRISLILGFSFLLWIFLTFLVPYFRFSKSPNFQDLLGFFLKSARNLFDTYVETSFLISNRFILFIFSGLFVSFGIPFIFIPPGGEGYGFITNLVFFSGMLVIAFGFGFALYKFIKFQFAGEEVFFNSPGIEKKDPLQSSKEIAESILFESSFLLIFRFFILTLVLFIFFISNTSPFLGVLLDFFLLSFLYLLKLEFFFIVKKRRNEDIYLRF